MVSLNVISWGAAVALIMPFFLELIMPVGLIA
jgi:hypothetical protein